MITVTRSKLYPVVAQPGPAWRWNYSYQVNEDPAITYGTGLRSLREMLRRKFPGSKIVEDWS